MLMLRTIPLSFTVVSISIVMIRGHVGWCETESPSIEGRYQEIMDDGLVGVLLVVWRSWLWVLLWVMFVGEGARALRRVSGGSADRLAIRLEGGFDVDCWSFAQAVLMLKWANFPIGADLQRSTRRRLVRVNQPGSDRGWNNASTSQRMG